MPAPDDTPAADTPVAVPGPVPRPQGGAPAGPPPGAAGPELEERVRSVEELPLAERAEGYRRLHEELSRRLDASPGTA